MFKIDGANTAALMPARTPLGASPGWFKQNPGAEPGTVVTGEFLNMLQAEVLAVLDAAAIVQDKADDTQLLKAILKIVSGATPVGMRSGFTGRNAPTGWILASGRTISKAGSGGTERANDDCKDLYFLYWADYADTELPIQTSAGAASVRGANAQADWDAGKRMTVPDYMDRMGIGRGDMAGGVAGRVTAAGGNVNTAILGKAGGVEKRTFTGNTQNANSPGGADGNVASQPTIGTHNHAFTTSEASIMNPFIVETVIIKL